MIKIIADSTCDLPEEMFQTYNINTIPLKVSIAGKTYDDKIDITTQELFALIEKHDEMSVTSAPAPRTIPRHDGGGGEPRSQRYLYHHFIGA